MGIKRKSGKIYYYTHGEYVREKLNTRYGCSNKYRIKDLGNGRKLLLCITKKKGPKGGKTKAIALLRHKDVDLRTVGKKAVRKAIKLLRKLRLKNLH